MNEKRIVTQARKAKEAGYEYVASIVKSVYNTGYYNVVPLDDIIKAGKWIPAPHGQWPSRSGGNWHGRIGQNWLPEKTILRPYLYKL